MRIYKNNKSPLIPVNNGVQQGSVLGPVLILIFTNDFALTSTMYKVIHFSDNTSIIDYIENQDALSRLTSIMTLEANKWFSTNKLSLHEQKTQNTVFTLRPLDTEVIHVKFLGLGGRRNIGIP